MFTLVLLTCLSGLLPVAGSWLLAPAWAQAVPASPDVSGNCQAPTWSPGGTQIAWEVNYHEKKTVELYVAPFSGTTGAPRKVVPLNRGSSAVTAGFDTASPEMVVHEISFSPESVKRLVYSTSGTTQDYDLYVDGAGVLASAPGTDGGPAWSPDGKYITFTSARTGQGDLYLLDLGAMDKPPLRLTGDNTASEVYAAWAPDSKRIAYVGHSPQGDNIYVVDNIAFPAPRAVTAWAHTQTRPSWSPDGNTLAFYSNHTDNRRFDLYTMPLGGTPTLIATDVLMSHRGPVWTPDSKHVLYVKNDSDRFSPVWAAPVTDPTRAAEIKTGTVGNGDLALTKRSDGSLWLAVAAQGRVGDSQRDFKRIYVLPLPTLPAVK